MRLVTALFGRPSDVAREPILVPVLRAQFPSSYLEERDTASASRDLAVHFKNILHEVKHSVTITAEKEIVSSVKEKLRYSQIEAKDQNGDAKSVFSGFKGLRLLRNLVTPDVS